MSEKSCMRTSIGGQALIEGVMMRGPEKTAMAVRHIRTGKIQLESWDNTTSKRPKWTRWPFIRGIFNFGETMAIGYKAMSKSIDMSGYTELEEEEKEQKKKSSKTAEDHELEPITPSDAENSDEQKIFESSMETETGLLTEERAEENDTAETQSEEEKQPEKLSGTAMGITVVFSVLLGLALSIFLFIFLPSFIYNHIKTVNPDLLDNRFMQSFCEGLIKIAIFLAYIASTALMKDIRRVYQYHGSEHKTIFCYEHGLPLTVENVRIQKRFHPRCGTSFMVLMLLVGIFIGFLIPNTLSTWLRVLIKILLLPLVVGIGYEAIKYCGRHDNWFTKIISAPGLWIQRLTTKEPDDSMIECAIAAFEAVIPDDPSTDRW